MTTTTTVAANSATAIFQSIKQSINSLAQIKTRKIDSNDNNCDIVLDGQKGSMSTYRSPQ